MLKLCRNDFIIDQWFLNLYARQIPNIINCFRTPKPQIDIFGTLFHSYKFHGPQDPIHGPLGGLWTPGSEPME